MLQPAPHVKYPSTSAATRTAMRANSTALTALTLQPGLSQRGGSQPLRISPRILLRRGCALRAPGKASLESQPPPLGPLRRLSPPPPLPRLTQPRCCCCCRRRCCRCCRRCCGCCSCWRRPQRRLQRRRRRRRRQRRHSSAPAPVGRGARKPAGRRPREAGRRQPGRGTGDCQWRSCSDGSRAMVLFNAYLSGNSAVARREASCCARRKVARARHCPIARLCSLVC
jgi:hypothetical protein